jgi:hypothetical protein
MANRRAVVARSEAVIAYRLGFYLGPVGIAENHGFSNSDGEGLR